MGGGSTFASGALQGKAAAGGARPTGRMSPTTAADTTESDKIRGTGDTSHLSAWQDAELASTAGSCDDSDQ